MMFFFNFGTRRFEIHRSSGDRRTRLWANGLLLVPLSHL